MTRELPGPNELLRPRDAAPVIYVPAHQWNCPLCDPDNTAPVASSTVVWLGQNTIGPHGRCSTCGQKYQLAKWGEAVPTILEQKDGWR